MALLCVRPDDFVLVSCPLELFCLTDLLYSPMFTSSLAALGNIYFFYTIPLTAAAAFANSENLTELFPRLEQIKQGEGMLNAELLSSLLAALIWALFFA